MFLVKIKLYKCCRKCSVSFNFPGQRSALCRPEAQCEDMNLSAVVWSSTWSFSLLICLDCNVFDIHTTHNEVFFVKEHTVALDTFNVMLFHVCTDYVNK